MTKAQNTKQNTFGILEFEVLILFGIWDL